MRWRARALPSTTGIDDLQVGRIGGEADLDLPARGGVEQRLVSEMVLHVTVAGDRLRDVVFRKLLEQDLERLAQNRGEHIETAAVGHAHDDLLDAHVGRVLDHRVEGRDERFTALEGEPLLADVFGVEKLFEQFRLVQTPQDAGLLFFGEAGLVARRLHPLLQPAPDFRVLNMDVFDPDPTAVGLTQAFDHIPKFHLPDVQVVADIVDLVQVLLRQAKLREGQPRGRARRLGKRIEVGLGVADGPVVVDETVDLGLLQAVDLAHS
jgi:hypothetical protein